jgi:hypothetical protein
LGGPLGLDPEENSLDDSGDSDMGPDVLCHDCTSLISVHKWPFSAISAAKGGIACAAHASTPPRYSLISLNLQKIAHFWIGN